MEPITRNIVATDWITLVLLGSLVCLVLAKLLFYGRFLNFIILPFNNKYIGLYNKKERLFNWFQTLLGLFFVLSAALFLYFASTLFEMAPHKEALISFPLLLVGVLTFLVLKIALQLGNGLVFGAYPLFNELIYKKLSYLTYSGIVLFFANIILNYVSPGSKAVFYVGFILFLSINVIGWFTVLKNSQKIVAHQFFYFILYLCALEFAPLIIIGHLLK
jgi:hypothetical protein